MYRRILLITCLALMSGTALADFSGSGPGFAIPENDPVGTSSDIVVALAPDEAITDVEITLTGLTHTWVGDLNVALSGPGGSLDIMWRTGSVTGTGGGDSSDLNGDYTFSDDGGDWWAAALSTGGVSTIAPGDYRPTTATGTLTSFADTFAGTMTNGTWTLSISDNAGGDTGALTGWELNITSAPVVCGDSIVGPGEECDDGNLANGDGCSSVCEVEDGFDCDDGMPTSCVLIVCGDGIVAGNEECDDAGDSPTCDADCTFAECGDGTVNPSAGEQCDDAGESTTCDADCTFAVCGDGAVNLSAGEQCDDAGQSSSCDADCTLAACGDGTTNGAAGEQCDDGNAVEGDGCDSNCTVTGCGNGIVTDGEQCDDGNTADGDGCQSDCQLPFCGDGIVDAAEECDDGGNADGDGCSAACVAEGACCSDGPNTESECFVATEEVCAVNGNSALFLGDNTPCTSDIDCFALAVAMDSMSAEETPEGVLVRWTTAMEIDTVAFRILREMPATPGNREKTLVVVVDRIGAMGNQISGADYAFLDNVKESAVAEYYYIEDLDVFGKVTRHGPIEIERAGREAPTSREGVTRQR